MAINDLKEIIRSGKDYFVKNDLNGFYEHVTDGVIDGRFNIEAEDVGKITKFFTDNGIDVAGLLSKRVPYACFCCLDIPPSFVNNGTFKLPPKFTEIDESAFSASNDFKIVDLRGVKYIGHWAFEATHTEEVWLGEMDSYKTGIAVFQDCEIRTVYLPKDKWHDHADKLCRSQFNRIGHRPKFEMY